MAHTIDKHDALPKLAASAIIEKAPVKTHTVKDQVVLAATNTDLPLGVAVATAASPGDPIAIQKSGVAKLVAGASIGAGAEVAVASTNGAVGVAAVASGFRRFAIGEAQEAVAAGATFSVLLRPRELTGTGV